MIPLLCLLVGFLAGLAFGEGAERKRIGKMLADETKRFAERENGRVRP